MKRSLYFLIGFILTYTPLSAEENRLIAVDFDGTNYTVSSVNSTTGAKTALKVLQVLMVLVLDAHL